MGKQLAVRIKVLVSPSHVQLLFAVCSLIRKFALDIF